MKFFWEKHVVSSFVSVLTLFALSFISISTVGAADHGQLVGENPRSDVPVVLDGDVRAHAQIGNRIFVGGNFQQVRRPNGTTIFRPAVNNGVLALEVNPNGNVLYVGGRFSSWNNSSVQRVARLNASGYRDTSFRASANANVRGLAVTNNCLWVALRHPYQRNSS